MRSVFQRHNNVPTNPLYPLMSIYHPRTPDFSRCISFYKAMCVQYNNTYTACGHTIKYRLKECIKKRRFNRGEAELRNRRWVSCIRSEGEPQQGCSNKKDAFCNNCRALSPTVKKWIGAKRKVDAIEERQQKRQASASHWRALQEASEAAHKRLTKEELSSEWKHTVTSARRLDPWTAKRETLASLKSPEKKQEEDIPDK